MAIRQYYRRLILGAILRPDSVGYWIAEQIRMHKKRGSGNEPTEQRGATLSIEKFVATLTDNRIPTPELLAEADGVYDSLAHRVDAFYGYDGHGRSPSSIERGDARVLYSVCRILRPNLVIETGVSDGVSSAVFLSAINRNGFGKLISIDFPLVGIPRLYGKEPGWVVPDALRGPWLLLRGPSGKLLDRVLATCGGVDIFFHDSEHSYECMWGEFVSVVGSLVPGGSIICDDALSSRALLDFATSRLGASDRVILTADGLGAVRKLSDLAALPASRPPDPPSIRATF